MKSSRKLLPAFAAATGCLTLILSEATCGLAGGLVYLAIFGLLFVSSIASLVVVGSGLDRRPSCLVSAAIYTPLVVLASMVLATGIRRHQLPIVYHAAASIPIALEDYKNTNSVFPSELADLVPDHMETEPKARSGLYVSWPFIYYPISGGIDYVLGFRVPLNLRPYFYNREHGTWHDD